MQALSVAVNQPKILPPMMMSGVVSAGTYAWYSNTNDYREGNSYLNGVVQNAQVAPNGLKASDGHDLNARIIGRTG